MNRYATKSPKGLTPAKHRRLSPARLLLLASVLVALVAVSPTAALGADALATTGPATDVHRTSAVLNGHFALIIFPTATEGPGVSECAFEWGTTAAYGNTALCSESSTFPPASEEDVSASLSGLTAGSAYHFRLKIKLTTGETFTGTDQIFTPDVSVTNPATKVHHTSVVLNGTVDPAEGSGVTKCDFEWGTTAAYGNTAPCNEGDVFSSLTGVTANLNNLTPGTTYHFRLHVETASSGPVDGLDQSFRPDTFPITHPEIGSFGSDGTSGSAFSGVNSLGFNLAARDLFVLDRDASDRLNQKAAIFGFDVLSTPAYAPLAGFDPLDVPDPAWEGSDMAVDNTAFGSAGNLYYSSNINSGGVSSQLREVFGYSSTGASLPGFPIAVENACGLAVDSAGHLWIGTGQGVEEFSADGTKIGATDLLAERTICRLAFDSSDNLYVAGWQGARKYTAASDYTVSSLLEPPFNPDISIDPSTDIIYVSNAVTEGQGRFPGGNRVNEYDQAGNYLGEFALSVGGYRVAIDSTNHHAYVAGLDKKVHVFDTTQSTTVKLPTVTTGSASAITGSTATISGFVDPEGLPVTECHIAWGEPGRFDNNVPCNPGSGSGDAPVSANISGLTPGTTYYFRVFASSADGTNAGQEVPFTTNFPPAVSSSPATSVSAGAADLNGLINPKGFATTYRFEWGLTAAYGNSVPVPDGNAGSGNTGTPVSAHIAALAPNTRYHWRLVAENLNGTTASEDSYFLTQGAPFAETTGAPLRTTTTAQLGARVTPRGFATDYYFEYGTEGPCDANLCTQTAPQSAGSGELTRLVSEQI